jgi:hypothetical protein
VLKSRYCLLAKVRLQRIYIVLNLYAYNSRFKFKRRQGKMSLLFASDVVGGMRGLYCTKVRQGGRGPKPVLLLQHLQIYTALIAPTSTIIRYVTVPHVIS